MRYKLQLPNHVEVLFDHADEGRALIYEAGFQNVRLWMTSDGGKTWEELGQHGIQAVYAGG